jgi:hypothetical protein
MAAEKPGCLFALLQLLGLRRKPAASLPLPQQTWEQLLRDDARPGAQAGAPPGLAPTVPAVLPYVLKSRLLSRSERAFYYALKKATADQWIICPQVRLGDIFEVPNRDFQWVVKIGSKHIDFLLCEPETFRPVLGIELDDVSHRRPERVKRDEFVNEVFAVAKLPLIRIPVQTSYEVNALKAQMDQTLAGVTRRLAELLPEQDPLAPLCPKCGAVMIRRIARRGEQRDKAFYGCSNFPRCKEVFRLE